MIIDLLLAVILVLAVIKGFQRGLIVAAFSLVAFIIGLAAAMKLSAVAAGYIGQAVKVSDQWLPVISFALVLLAVVLLVNWGARLLEKSVQFVMLGWVNKIGGILLYAALYITLFSILLFYAEQTQFIKKETISASATYSFIQPWGPKAIEGFGKLIPVFKDSFTELEQFFGRVSGQIPAA
jgi:membrane protein required for colicin V production